MAPGLPAELRARRTHLLAELAFVDAKRSSEAALRAVPTTGLRAWVFRNRDTWRDFKACDSSMFGHLLSSVPGNRGRDDLMLTGLTQDWADLGPDLRNGECAQSVLTLTGGSLSTASLVACYERTVWMLNAQLTPEAGVQRARLALLFVSMDINVWNSSTHRHDVWRYFTLAADACALAQERDLIIMRAAHQSDFSEEFVTALILFVMEQWWAGINLAIGIGSLIEAQPGHTANDRLHHEE